MLKTGSFLFILFYSISNIFGKNPIENYFYFISLIFLGRI